MLLKGPLCLPRCCLAGLLMHPLVLSAALQALHRVRVLAETDFQSICEENALRDKLYALEQLCEQQGIADSDEAAAAGSK